MRRSRNTAALASVACVLLPLAAAAAPEYWTPKAAMIEAIDAPGGAVSGILRGPVADRIAATTTSSAPVRIHVSTIKSFQQEGCKRLNVRLTQDNVPTKDGKTITLGLDYGINLCRDGSPPTEGMDLEALGKLLQRQQ